MRDITEFQAGLSDNNSPVAIDFSSNSSTLLIAFGGRLGGLGIPPFEFFKFTADLKINKIFVRDLWQTWYHHGLPGISTSIEETARWLSELITEQNVNNLVIIGNSNGGHAAILFGWLLKADRVHAFSPKTFALPLKRMLNLEYMQLTQLRELIRELWDIQVRRNPYSEYMDLKNVLKKSNQKTEYHIHYCTARRNDRIHANNLRGLDGVHFHAYKEGGHTLVKYLRDSGQLTGIITESMRFKDSKEV